MSDPSTTPLAKQPVIGPGPGWCAGIAAATAAAYAGSLRGGFLYDDLGSIVGNPSIRHFLTALRPPAGETVSGRPILNLSLAVNYAISGTGVWSYHALNVLIHIASALVLFGIVRRTLASGAAGRRGGACPSAVAFAAALIWAVHPLQAESVAYVIQRAESLMGLFYLVTLYAFIRYADDDSRRGWAVLSVGACLLGMGTKEAMATAPAIVLLYDRTFAAGSFREAWRRRRPFYVALMACWVPVAFLAASTGGRAGTAGFGSGVPWWAYAMIQLKAVALYLRLAVWPNPLVGDYGRVLAVGPMQVALGAAVFAALAAGTVVLLVRRSPAGFLGAWFLVILAPSSSVIPVSTEVIAEHRMYLPLAAVAVAAALALDAALPRRGLFYASIGIVAVALGVLTVRRVRAYGSSFAFWSDVVGKVPENAGAWNNLGALLAERGDQAGAIADFGRALALVPAYADAHRNLANSLFATGRLSEAVENYEAAIRFRPDDALIHLDLAHALAAEKRQGDAAPEFREALRLDPGLAVAWSGLADALVDLGNLPGAAEAYGRAVALRPGIVDTRVNYGNVLAELGRSGEAMEEFGAALRLQPDAADIHNNLGSLLAGSGRLSEAQAQFEQALRLKPDYEDASNNLRRVLELEARARP
jgi:tetratricopeptide (TPR) repeat protein